MQEFRFLDWQVYKDARQLIRDIYVTTGKFTQNFRYELGSQINRSVISIALNIAEGSGKGSDKDLNRFFNIAIGSSNETLAGLDIARDNGLITQAQFDDFKIKITDISRQIGGFQKRLKN
ncbi:MAG: hypothetical protein A3D92_01815 [Bacteroidetes bacterium RIFCSPHIGHO2_02_FULL_44_7]|nr:MAG: hypothetical protein A3D92_01815 [Bacteroidetes bacterium RIFCSPHIGHO2_02_FULL_44_7]